MMVVMVMMVMVMVVMLMVMVVPGLQCFGDYEHNCDEFCFLFFLESGIQNWIPNCWKWWVSHVENMISCDDNDNNDDDNDDDDNDNDDDQTWFDSIWTASFWIVVAPPLSPSLRPSSTP